MIIQQEKRFESQAKLMISGEYLVLKGALSLSVPLQYGQKLIVSQASGIPSVTWRSMINNEDWFYATLLLPHFQVTETDNKDLSETLVNILLTAKTLNPEFLEAQSVYQVTSLMDFNPEWGIGSSSSLISNIAYWADCDPFKLNNLIFNGSGYDIACARSQSPIIYEIKSNIPSYREADFHPRFHRHLYFVYLNRKQNSRESIKNSDLNKITPDEINTISMLTLEMEQTENLEAFQVLIDKHEQIIGNIIQKKSVKELYFNDFRGSVKSLGAWGGDFILVASAESEEYVHHYFSLKNLNTIFRYDQIVLM